MFQRTTNYSFQKYGTVQNDWKELDNYQTSQFKIKTKYGKRFYSYSEPVYLECISGIALLVILTEEGAFQFETYVLHRVIQLKPNVRFSIISVSNNCKISQSTPKDATVDKIDLPKEFMYEYERKVAQVSIKENMGCYYQVRGSHYLFPGEVHEFWELTFIDSGQMYTEIEGEGFTLNPYEFLLYAPHQFHTQQTFDSSCSYFTILFDMDVPMPELIMDRVYKAHRELHEVITKLIHASQTDKMYNDDLVLCYLTEVIVNVLQYDFDTNVPVASSPTQQHIENEMLDEILMYIDNNIFEPLFIEDLCNKFSLSRSTLQKLFRYNLNIAPKQYISNLKLEQSKVLIKENKYLMSEIAEMLGFGSVHYFSKKFKQAYEISPTVYAKTVIK